MTDNLKLSALYYPFSMCTDELALKRFLLIFDRVGFIYPSSSGFAFAKYEPVFRGQYVRMTSRPQVFTTDLDDVNIQERREFEPWVEMFAELESKGLVFAIDPQLIVKENDDLITNATLIDCQDETFIKSVNNALFLAFQDNEYLKINRHPSSISGSMKVVISDDYLANITFGWRIGIRGLPQSLKTAWFQEESHIINIGSSDKNMPASNATELSRMVVDDDGFYYLQPRYAASLALNRALVTSVKYGMPIVTDNIYFQNAITQKSQKVIGYLQEHSRSRTSETIGPIFDFITGSQISKQNRFSEILQKEDVPVNLQKIESERLVSLVLSNLISEKALMKISLSQLIKYREQSQLERERLLITLYEWAYEVEELLNKNKANANEITERIYKTKVLPEANRYQKTLRRMDKRLVSDLVGSTYEQLGVSLTATAVGSLLAGLTMEQALILAVAVGSPIVGKAIKEILNYRIERDEARNESPIAYLLRMEQSG